MLRSIALATLVLSSICAFAAPTPILVNCGAGQSLNRTLGALNKLTPATVQFTGTCTEYVLIDGFNNLTIKGTNGATIQQPTATPPAGTAYCCPSRHLRALLSPDSRFSPGPRLSRLSASGRVVRMF